MIERAGIKFTELPDEDFDPALGESTGAATIFGATGGVMEAALRTAVELVTGETLEKVEFHDVRGTDGIKEASYDVGGLHLNVCVASGLTNCDAVLKAVQSGEKHYDFIEFMACPGGCVAGAGTMQSIKKSAAVVGMYAKQAEHQTATGTHHVAELDKLVD